MTLTLLWNQEQSLILSLEGHRLGTMSKKKRRVSVTSFWFKNKGQDYAVSVTQLCGQFCYKSPCITQCLKELNGIYEVWILLVWNRDMGVCVLCEIHLVKMIHSFERNQSLTLTYNYSFLLRNGHFVLVATFEDSIFFYIYLLLVPFST